MHTNIVELKLIVYVEMTVSLVRLIVIISRPNNGYYRKCRLRIHNKKENETLKSWY